MAPPATPEDVKQYKLHLLQACAENNVKPVKKLVEEEGADWDNVKNADKQNVLHVAAMEGAQDVVDMLMAYPRVTTRIDIRDRALRTPLHLASAMGFTDIVHRLLECRAQVNVQDEKGCTPLLLAVKFDWAAAAGVLLDSRADPMMVDKEGDSALDIALQKPDSEMAQIMLHYANKKLTCCSPTMSATFKEVNRCLFPRWGHLETSKYAEPISPNSAQQPSQDRGAGVGKLSDSAVIELNGIELAGLKPVLVQGLPVEAVGSTPQGAQTSSSSSWWRSAADAETQPAAGQAVLTGLPLRAEFAFFRLHLFFDESVPRLEFEVEWQEEQPAAGAVKPGGAASRRGLVQGDTICDIGGVRTAGKSRDELLPALKQRPMLMKVERTAQVPRIKDPYLELEVHMNLSGCTDQGFELMQRGQLVVASVVRKNSQAFAAGILEGDAIVGAGAEDVTRLSKSKLLALLVQDRPQQLTVRRRPLGSNIMLPWAWED